MSPVSLTRWEGGFACCICFEAVANEDAWQDKDGQKWDLCSAECARQAGAE